MSSVTGSSRSSSSSSRSQAVWTTSCRNCGHGPRRSLVTPSCALLAYPDARTVVSVGTPWRRKSHRARRRRSRPGSGRPVRSRSALAGGLVVEERVGAEDVAVAGDVVQHAPARPESRSAGTSAARSPGSRCAAGSARGRPARTPACASAWSITAASSGRYSAWNVRHVPPPAGSNSPRWRAGVGQQPVPWLPRALTRQAEAPSLNSDMPGISWASRVKAFSPVSTRASGASARRPPSGSAASSRPARSIGQQAAGAGLLGDGEGQRVPQPERVGTPRAAGCPDSGHHGGERPRPQHVADPVLQAAHLGPAGGGQQQVGSELSGSRQISRRPWKRRNSLTSISLRPSRLGDAPRR